MHRQQVASRQRESHLFHQPLWRRRFRNMSILSFVLLVAVATRASAAADTVNLESVLNDGIRVVQAGSKVDASARFPLSFLGDWQKVLVAPDVSVMTTGKDLIFTEGPLVREDQDNAGGFVLYVSDNNLNNIYRLSEGKGLEVWATQSGGIDHTEQEHQNVAEPGSNGMATDELDPRFVVINQHGLRRVVKCRLDDHNPGAPLAECPDLRVIADAFVDEQKQRLRFNSPNDVVVHPHDGSVWFTDPPYGLLEKDRFCDEWSCANRSYLDEKSEIGWNGIYRVDRGTNAVDLVARHHHRPNGLAFSPDAKTLWVCDSTIYNPSLTAYDVNDDKYDDDDNDNNGSFSYLGRQAKAVLNPATLGTELGTANDLPSLTGIEGLTDGLKIDPWGYIWTSIPNGFAVIDATSNEVICQILLGINTSNLAFGNNGDVWLTGKGGIWKLQRKIPEKNNEEVNKNNNNIRQDL